MRKLFYIRPSLETLQISFRPLLNEFSMTGNVSEWEIEEEVDVNARI